MKNPKDMLSEAVDGKIDLLHKLRAETRVQTALGNRDYEQMKHPRSSLSAVHRPVAQDGPTIIAIERDLAFHAPVYCWDQEIIGSVLGIN